MIIALLLIHTVLPKEFPAYSHSSFAFSREILSEVSEKQIDNTKPWDKNDANPLISARRAIELSSVILRKIVRDNKFVENGSTWKLHSLRLKPLQNRRWIWVVRYELGSNLGGSPHGIDIVVLMNGTVVQPKVRNAVNHVKDSKKKGNENGSNKSKGTEIKNE